jgi:hypothetical protein
MSDISSLVTGNEVGDEVNAAEDDNGKQISYMCTGKLYRNTYSIFEFRVWRLKTGLVEVKKVMVANDCGFSPTEVPPPRGQTIRRRERKEKLMALHDRSKVIAIPFINSYRKTLSCSTAHNTCWCRQ